MAPTAAPMSVVSSDVDEGDEDEGGVGGAKGVDGGGVGGAKGVDDGDGGGA